jgi:hypothetical protein
MRDDGSFLTDKIQAAFLSDEMLVILTKDASALLTDEMPVIPTYQTPVLLTTDETSASQKIFKNTLLGTGNMQGEGSFPTDETLAHNDKQTGMRASQKRSGASKQKTDSAPYRVCNRLLLHGLFMLSHCTQYTATQT